MPRKFDISNYSFDEQGGKWYQSESGELVRNKNTLRRLYEATGKQNVGRTPKHLRQTVFTSKYAKYFKSGTQFESRGGVDRWARDMTLRGGKDPNYNWRRVQFRPYGKTDVVSRTGNTNQWGSNVSRGQKGGESMAVFDRPEQLLQHFQITIYQLELQAESWRILVGQRALKVFENSFKYERFYTNDSTKWQELAQSTLNKKRKRGKNNGILKEYEDLRKSIVMENREGQNITEITTKDVEANEDHHKYQTLSYAALHNEGMGTIGRIGRRHVKRQFMGHSSYLDPFKDAFMSTMIKRYLFDSVFLTKKK